MHNVRNRMAGNKRGTAADAVFERRHAAGKSSVPPTPKLPAKPAPAPFLLGPSAPLPAEALLIQRSLAATTARPALPGMTLAPPAPDSVPEPLPDRAARRRAAKAAPRPKRKAQKAAGAKPPPPRRRKTTSTRLADPPEVQNAPDHAVQADRPPTSRARTASPKNAGPEKSVRRRSPGAAQPSRKGRRATSPSIRAKPIATAPADVPALVDQIVSAIAAIPPEPALDRMTAQAEAGPKQAKRLQIATAASRSTVSESPAQLEPPTEAHVPLPEPGYAPLPRSRAVTRTGEGLVGRVADVAADGLHRAESVISPSGMPAR